MAVCAGLKLAINKTLKNKASRQTLGILGIAPHVAEGVLNHLPPKLVRTYDKNKYEKEKREALDLWAAHLTALASGKAK